MPPPEPFGLLSLIATHLRVVIAALWLLTTVLQQEAARLDRDLPRPPFSPMSTRRVRWYTQILRLHDRQSLTAPPHLSPMSLTSSSPLRYSLPTLAPTRITPDRLVLPLEAVRASYRLLEVSHISPCGGGDGNIASNHATLWLP